MISRKYFMSDRKMRQRCQVMIDFFTDYKTNFVLLFPGFADPYKANWQTALDTAYNIKSDLRLRKEIRVFKTERDLKRKNGMTLLRELNKYVKLAFSNYAGRKQFRLTEIERARSSTKKSIALIDLAFDISRIPANQTILIAKGYTLIKINALATASTELQTAQGKYLSVKKSRPVIKTNYIIAHNNAWKFMTEINLAAPIVFPTDKVRRGLFGLYNKKKKKKEGVEG